MAAQKIYTIFQIIETGRTENKLNRSVCNQTLLLDI